MCVRAMIASSIPCNCGPRNKARGRSVRAFQIRFRSCRRRNLSLDRQFDIDRALFLAQSAAELRKCNVLQLPNAFACNAEFLSHFLERFGLAAVQPEALENDFLLAIVQHIKQSAYFIAKIFVAEQLERRLSFLVPDNLPEFSRIIVANRCIERSWADRYGLELRDFSAGDPDLVTKFVVRWFTAELLAHLQGNPAHLGNFVHEVDRKTDGFALIGQSPLDRLLDPPCRVRAELPAFSRVKTLHRLHQTDISLRDQVEQRQAKICIIMRDLDDETQIRANH